MRRRLFAQSLQYDSQLCSQLLLEMDEHLFYIHGQLPETMTSQLALMNSMAVALASDSAVTIGSKTYDGVRKIFKLNFNPKIGIF